MSKNNVLIHFAQQRLWKLWQLDPTSSAYNTPLIFHLQGELKPELLKLAIKETIRRQDGLMSCFKQNETGQVYMQVNVDAEFSFHEQSLEKNSPQEQVLAEINRLINQPFDLSEFPLFRLYLLKRTEQEYFLIMNFHHILSDGHSATIFLRDIAKFYNERLESPNFKLPALDYSLSDYLAEDNNHQSEDSATFWQQYIHSSSTELTALKPQAKKSKTAGRVRFTISEEIYKNFKSKVKQLRATPFLFYMTVFAGLLYRVFAQEDFAIGYPVNIRYPKCKDICGFLVNNLPMPVHVDNNTSFLSLLESFKQNRKRVQGYESIAIGEIKKYADTPQGEELYNVALVPANFAIEGFNLTEVEAVSLDVRLDDIKYPLLLLYDGLHNNELAFEFDANLFSYQFIESMRDRFISCMSLMLTEVNSSICKTPLLLPYESDLIFKQVNNTKQSFQFDTFIELFHYSVREKPEQIAICYPGKKLTYRELDVAANKIAKQILAKGLPNNAIVPVLCERCPEMLIGQLAVLKAGLAYLPIDINSPTKRTKQLIDAVKASFILATKPVSELDEYSALNIQEYQDLPESGALELEVKINAETPAYVIFTSGSTGSPKAVVISHGAISNYAQAMLKKLQPKEGARFCALATVAADLSYTANFVALASANTLVMLPEDSSFDAGLLLEFFNNMPVDYLKIVPSHLSALLEGEHPEKLLPKCCLILGGEALPNALVKRVHKLSPNCQILNHYGPTEATVGALTFSILNDQQKYPIGKPLANVKAFILNEQKNSVPLEVVGELYLGGAGLSQGYLADPTLTADKFLNCKLEDGSSHRLYKTGDRARFLADGNIEFLGRIDNQIKFRGFRVELGEIEASLLTHPQVQSAVVKLERQGEQQTLVAYVIKSDSELTEANLQEYLKAILPSYMLPSLFIFKEAFSLTSNGKIDRRKLQANVISNKVDNDSLDDRAQVLIAVLQKVLGRENIPASASLFELGGDSIVAIQVAAKLQKQSFRLAPKQLLSNDAIAKVATHMVATDKSTATPKKNEQEESVAVALTAIQKQFLRQYNNQPNFYSHSILFQCEQKPSLQKLFLAIKALAAKHDIFQLRFKQVSGEWQQHYVPVDQAKQAIALDVINLVADHEPGLQQELEQCANQSLASLDITKGPIMRMTLFYSEGLQQCYLHLCMHHLFVDGLSWRLLIADLFSFSQSFKKVDPSTCIAKKQTRKTYLDKIYSLIEEDALRQEKQYWANFFRHADEQLNLKKGSYAEQSLFKLVFSEQETSQLLAASGEENTESYLLTAFAMEVSKLLLGDDLLVDVENHGRNLDANSAELIGWFTTIYPVRITLCKEIFRDNLMLVRRNLLEAKEHGDAYSLLKEFSELQFANDDPRAFCFNYLGNLDALTQQGWQLVDPDFANARSHSLQRRYPVEVLSWVLQGKLNITINGHQDNQETLKAMLLNIKSNLLACY